VCAIFFAAGPQIASGKAQENGPASGVYALTLKRQENLFDRVAHA
jgi:hypothetical protein